MWILIFATLIANHNFGLTNVSGFETKAECESYADYLFSDWPELQPDAKNWYHQTTATNEYRIRRSVGYLGDVVTTYSCVPRVVANCNGDPNWKKCPNTNKPQSELHFEGTYPELCDIVDCEVEYPYGPAH